MPLQSLQSSLAKEVHGMTMQDAHKQQICIECKQPIRQCTERTTFPGGIYSKAGEAEYAISGLCEHCFDTLFIPKQ